jgi:hypothetical protein
MAKLGRLWRKHKFSMLFNRRLQQPPAFSEPPADEWQAILNEQKLLKTVVLENLAFGTV